MKAVGCGDPKTGTSEWLSRSEAAWRQNNPLNLYIISHSRAQKKGIGFLGNRIMKKKVVRNLGENKPPNPNNRLGMRDHAHSESNPTVESIADTQDLRDFLMEGHKKEREQLATRVDLERAAKRKSGPSGDQHSFISSSSSVNRDNRGEGSSIIKAKPINNNKVNEGTEDVIGTELNTKRNREIDDSLWDYGDEDQGGSHLDRSQFTSFLYQQVFEVKKAKVNAFR